jgi:NTE family protein
MELGRDRKYLVFQGGGALGAYQAGAYEALHEAGIRPEWIAGISIGAINSAIIAGSPEHKRVDNLRTFWEMVSTGPSSIPCEDDPLIRKWYNEYSATLSAMSGVNGFYIPRSMMPWQYLAEREAAISYYDTTPLIGTLESLVDFDRINAKEVRLSLGAVDVITGNFAYFDNHESKPHNGPLTAKHVAASGALPPGFPPVEIDGHYYWDGGLVSNTPLQWVLDQRKTTEDICVFQADLFSASGHLPVDMADVMAREKEIRYSSRTRLNTNEAKKNELYEKALQRVLEKLPPELREDRDVRLLQKKQDRGAVTVVHLIYQRRRYETHYMDNEFSRLTMLDHWAAGYKDVEETLRCKVWTERVIPDDGFVAIDHRKTC